MQSQKLTLDRIFFQRQYNISYITTFHSIGVNINIINNIIYIIIQRYNIYIRQNRLSVLFIILFGYSLSVIQMTIISDSSRPIVNLLQTYYYHRHNNNRYQFLISSQQY